MDLQSLIRWGFLGLVVALILHFVVMRLIRRNEERFREKRQGSMVRQMAEDMAGELPTLPEDPQERTRARLQAYEHLDEALREFDRSDRQEMRPHRPELRGPEELVDDDAGGAIDDRDGAGGDGDIAPPADGSAPAGCEPPTPPALPPPRREP